MKHFGWGRRWAERAGGKAGIMAGIFLVILGCAGCGEGRQNAQEASGFVPAYQFAPGFGIIAIHRIRCMFWKMKADILSAGMG